MNPRSVAALLLSRQMPSANSTTAAYGAQLYNCASNIVTNFGRKLQYFFKKVLSYYLLSHALFFLEIGVPPFEKPEAEDDLYNGGAGRCEGYVEQRSICGPAHKIGYRYPDTESANEALYHNEGCAAASVKISDEAE